MQGGVQWEARGDVLAEVPKESPKLDDSQVEHFTPVNLRRIGRIAFNLGMGWLAMVIGPCWKFLLFWNGLNCCG